jgi:hypothetical protein
MKAPFSRFTRSGYLLLACLGGLLLAGGLLSGLARAANPDAAQASPAVLSREADPVVLPGAQLPDLLGAPIAGLYAYAYQGGAAQQIPLQVDERSPSGEYMPLEDGLLDGNDELAFMAADGGDAWPAPAITAGGATLYPRNLLAINDPLDGKQAFVYLFSSPLISQTFTADYVTFTAASDRIESPGRYAMQFNPSHPFRDVLTLGNTPTDLLDRDKIRLSGRYLIFNINANEESATKQSVMAIDGPVRVTRVSTATITQPFIGTQSFHSTLFAYRSLLVQPIALTIDSSFQVLSVRYSTDWSPAASGMLYFDANTPGGVTIDGQPDAVAASPITRWRQVSGPAGGVVEVAAIPAALGGTQSTYYKDNSTYDANDTGDHLSYGDSGFQIANPGVGSYTLLSHSYFISGTTTNQGSLYQSYYDTPLQVTVLPFVPGFQYLPLVNKP